MKKAIIKLEMTLEQDEDGTWSGYEDPKEYLWENRMEPDDFDITIVED